MQNGQSQKVVKYKMAVKNNGKNFISDNLGEFVSIPGEAGMRQYIFTWIIAIEILSPTHYLS